MKQKSRGTCPVSVVLSKQAAHAPRLTQQTPAPCRAKKSKNKNAESFQMESKSGPCGPDVDGPADDADLSCKIPIRSAPHGDRLDLALVGRRPFEILPLGELSVLKKWPHGCDGIRSCCAVTIASGTVPRVVETFRGGRAPMQARRAGTQASKAGRHPRQAGRHPRQACRHPRRADRHPRQAGRLDPYLHHGA